MNPHNILSCLHFKTSNRNPFLSCIHCRVNQSSKLCLTVYLAAVWSVIYCGICRKWETKASCPRNIIKSICFDYCLVFVQLHEAHLFWFQNVYNWSWLIFQNWSLIERNKSVFLRSQLEVILLRISVRVTAQTEPLFFKVQHGLFICLWDLLTPMIILQSLFFYDFFHFFF